jgi:two-component system, chemotaxis family, chemotaxis protein CheY
MTRVLVVEDDTAIRRLLQVAFERAGYEVSCADDGRKAIRLFGAAPPDVVVTDLVMPEFDGIETIVALRRIAPAVPIVAISGAAALRDVDLLRMAQQLGASATLQKPFAPAELVALVGTLVGSA